MDTGSTSHCDGQPATSRRCITESVTATFDFKVTDYAQLKGIDPDDYISSPIFRVGGHNWTIRFYRYGEHNETGGSASAYLYCLSRGEDVSAKFTLYLLGQVQESNYHKMYRIFSGSKGWGYHVFAKRKKLKSLSLLGDGCFTIRCVLTIIKSSPLLELPGNLERMLRDGVGTDVTFVVGGRSFRAHRAILAARSPVFDAQLFDRTTEIKDVQRVEVVVDDMEPAIFEMLLYFVYTDLLPPPCDDDEAGHDALVIQRLLVAADRYGLDRLKLMCEDELCRKIDVETVTDAFALADRHHCKQLRNACLQFMACPKVLDAILANDGFKNLRLETR